MRMRWMHSSGCRWVILLSFPVFLEMCQLWSCLSALAFSIFWTWCLKMPGGSDFVLVGSLISLNISGSFRYSGPLRASNLTVCRRIEFKLVLSIGIWNFWSSCHVFVCRNKYNWELGGDWFLSEFRGAWVYGSQPSCKAHGSHWRLINSVNQTWTKS